MKKVLLLGSYPEKNINVEYIFKKIFKKGDVIIPQENQHLSQPEFIPFAALPIKSDQIMPEKDGQTKRRERRAKERKRLNSK